MESFFRVAKLKSHFKDKYNEKLNTLYDKKITENKT